MLTKEAIKNMTLRRQALLVSDVINDECGERALTERLEITIAKHKDVEGDDCYLITWNSLDLLEDNNDEFEAPSAELVERIIGMPWASNYITNDIWSYYVIGEMMNELGTDQICITTHFDMIDISWDYNSDDQEYREGNTYWGDWYDLGVPDNMIDIYEQHAYAIYAAQKADWDLKRNFYKEQ